MSEVHIACIDDGHIVPRMAGWLAAAYGWTVGARVERRAAVNLYMPYTMLAPLGTAPTKTAAWFTHHEPDTGKAAIWAQAAGALDLRLVTAPLYLPGLAARGATRQITPGVDRDHFTPGGQASGGQRIGVSGLGGGRKGPALAQRLRSNGYEVVAAGTGWGLDERHYTYGQMPAWYRQIDVYLCTAAIEGIPAPPLEALACGVRVVVPRGVGMMDLLPEAPGVRHYARGNYEDMALALDMALSDDVEQEALRALTEPYTVRAWCESIAAALAEVTP